MTLEIRTLRSENFALKIKRWWKRSDRNAARLSLKVMEHYKDEFQGEVSRQLLEEMGLGRHRLEKPAKEP